MVRRMFSASPRDPRYHMLSHISAKFKQDVKPAIHEPRAALFLNRFTRTLTIMYATSGLRDVIGISAEEMQGRSFYYCIAENCLQDAVKCLENAKGNDSIAYLRFWFRDPRTDDNTPPDENSDDDMAGTETSDDQSTEGGVQLDARSVTSPGSSASNAVRSGSSMDVDASADENQPNSRTSSGDSTHVTETHEAIFGQNRDAQESTSSLETSPRNGASPQPQPIDPIELEAVISCTSDGLVVCLRKARPMIPHPTARPSRPAYTNGLFAAPWAQEPILPPIEIRAGAGFATPFAPALGPTGAAPATQPVHTGPSNNDFMNAIREQAVFAWALTGINGMLSEYAHGKPLGESLPEEGVPIWEPDARTRNEKSSNGSHHSSESNGTSENERPAMRVFGDPGLDRGSMSRSSGSVGAHSVSGTPNTH
jgi:hypothetical protein